MYTTSTVKQILGRKGNKVWSINADDTVYDALREMAEKNIGALLIYKEDKIVGIFSERDYARKLALRNKKDRSTPVSEVMTKKVIGVGLDQRADECLALMTDKFIRHLPVVDDRRKVVGVISIGDVVKEILADQTFIIDQLLNYITVEEIKPPVPEKSAVELT
jgi:CBS domain-containing protein